MNTLFGDSQPTSKEVIKEIQYTCLDDTFSEVFEKLISLPKLTAINMVKLQDGRWQVSACVRAYNNWNVQIGDSPIDCLCTILKNQERLRGE